MMFHLSKYRKLLIGLSATLFFYSCAKENLPIDESELSSYNKLYMVQASLAGNVSYQLYVNTLKTDTSFSIYSVAIGGGKTAAADVQLTFQPLGAEYVEAYNRQKNTSYKLLPASSYTIVTDTVIKRGNSSTGILPIHINLPALERGTQYVLPVKFSSNASEFEVDEQRQVSYFVFRATIEPTGKKIGNIPNVTDPRTRIIDFYDDILVRDTLGDLWLYPLGESESLGEPYKIGSGFSNVISLIFNKYYSKLIGIYSDGPFKNHIVSWTVTQPPSVAIGEPWLVFKTTDYATPGFKEYFWNGPNGYWYGIWTNNNLYYFNGLNAAGVLVSRASIGTGWNPFLYKANANIGGLYHVTSYVQGLLVYQLNANYLGYSANRWMAGDGFFPYHRMFSIDLKHLVCVKTNGDVVIYRDFDVYGFYHAI